MKHNGATFCTPRIVKMGPEDSVDDVRFIDRHSGYVVTTGPEGRSVLELTPIGVSWSSAGVQRSHHNTAGVCAVPLADNTGIAIVEAPFDRGANKAGLLNADGSTRSILRVPNAQSATFYDVLYMNGVLTFLAATSNGDIQVQVDEQDGSVKGIHQFR
jgi:hypothetical protein